MAATPALRVLDQAKIAYTTHEFEHDPDRAHATGGGPRGYGAETARTLGIDPNRLFKTLIAQAGKRLVVGVVPVAGHLDLKALAKAVGEKKAEMAEPAAAERSSGYVTGGISPLGQRTRLTTVIDESALTWGTVLVSAGKRGSQVELAPADLVRVTGATVAAIATE